MTDKELTELAAKAAGIEGGFVGDVFALDWADDKDYWNPLTDDGDALRLAVKLSLDVNIYNSVVTYERAEEYIEEHFPQGVIHDVAAATRRAIVRVAAEIGKAM